MFLIKKFKAFCYKIRSRLRDSTFDNVLWIVNIVPNIAGFSIRSKKMAAPFWILLVSLLFYVYILGIVVYQLNIADGVKDFIKSYVNISLLIIILNITWWWLIKRPQLFAMLKIIEESDRNARDIESLRDKYTKMLTKIKIVICIFYIWNYVNAIAMYLPTRSNVDNEFSMALCVGLEPLTVSPNRQICSFLLCLQEICIMMAVLNYQALLCFVVAHTAIMYQMLSEEMMTFNDFYNLEENKAYVKQRLPFIIRRHTSILLTCRKLKSLYSFPIGVDFGSNAVCMSLLFYLPLEELIKYIPVLGYCFFSFFLYCFLCQALTNASEVFERAIYSCGWENFDLREKKLIYVMLRQAQKPVVILAADIIPVNVYTFASTLQFMFKFVTVVKL